MVVPAHTNTEPLRLELQEALATFRHQTLLLIQVVGIAATADSLLLAYGFAQKESAILLVASAMPIIMVASYVEILHVAVPIVYAAMILEQKLELHDAPLAATFARRHLRPIIAAIGQGEDLTDPRVRQSILKIRHRAWLTSRPAIALQIAFVLQFCLVLVSLLVFH